MPNGGSHCCGECYFNKAVWETIDLSREQLNDRFDHFVDLSFCTLRQVNITNPFWTYCRNFRSSDYINHDTATVTEQDVKGYILASGLYEGYVKIPWHGSTEPNVSVPCTCLMCNRITESGITLEVEDKVIGFCTNLHYVEWWKTKHSDSDIDTSYFITPEEYYTID
jgi:hypothetical protein